ncbi:MAG: hypothetical protein JWP01_753 [Myxococcales bacterium]|nr:hypothetical protein [Myxococcales bacterium]
MDDLTLKRIPSDGVPQALEKAERYRLLNDPAQAESICRDVLVVDDDNQIALRALILALTDQFGSSGAAGAPNEARAVVAQLDDEYDRAYFSGIIHERETRAYLGRTTVIRSDAYDGFRQAMEWYERAEALRPHSSVDAVLRWNCCVRAIERERLEPETGEREPPLE